MLVKGVYRWFTPAQLRVTKKREINMPVEYKPCPFCGSKNIDYNNDTGPGDGGFWEWIECVDCGARCPDEDTWNRRSDTSTIQE
jgi:hypothetical protein